MYNIKPFVFFWVGETADAMRAAGPATMVLACFLNGGASTNQIGFFRLDVDRASSATGLPQSQVLAEMRVLEQVGFLKYDGDTNMVWIIGRADFSLGAIRANDKKRIKLVNDEFATIPSRCPMRMEFFDQYQIMLHLNDPDDCAASCAD